MDIPGPSGRSTEQSDIEKLKEMFTKLMQRGTELMERVNQNEHSHQGEGPETATTSHQAGLEGDARSKAIEKMSNFMELGTSILAGLEQLEKTTVQEGPEIRTPHEQASNLTLGSNAGHYLDIAIDKMEGIFNNALLDGRQTMSQYHQLGLLYNHRYDDTHQIGDLDCAIRYYSNGLEEDRADESHAELSDSLGLALWTRFRKLGQSQDLENAITYHKQALRLDQPDHSLMPRFLGNFANALTT